MRYLTARDILVIHARIIDATSGSHGVRDIGLLQSIARKPQTAFGGKELYRGAFTKAAVYFEAIAQHHVFVDGNKRTSVAVAARFLFLNGFTLTLTNEELVAQALHVVLHKPELKEIAAWLKAHSKKIRK